MRIASIGHAFLAITVLGLGIVGVLYPGFVPIWTPIPVTVPAHRVLLYVGPALSLVSGIGVSFSEQQPWRLACSSPFSFFGTGVPVA